MAWLIKNKNDSLAHAGIGSHKYIDKYRDKNGNWQYIYEDDGPLTIGKKQKEAEMARHERVLVNRQNISESVRRAGRAIGNKVSPIANEYADRWNTMSKVNARSRAEKESIDKAVNDYKTKEHNEWWMKNVGNRYQLGDNSLRDERDLSKLAPHPTAHRTDAGSQQAYRDKMKQVRDSVKDSAREEATKTVNNLTKQLNAKKNAAPFRGGDDRGYRLDQQRKAEEHARQVAEAERRNKPTGIPANATQPVAGDKAKTNAKHLQEVRSNMLRNRPSYDGIPANATRYNKEEHDILAREYNKRKKRGY